jgi:hypothetical protein
MGNGREGGGCLCDAHPLACAPPAACRCPPDASLSLPVPQNAVHTLSEESDLCVLAMTYVSAYLPNHPRASTAPPAPSPTFPPTARPTVCPLL